MYRDPQDDAAFSVIVTWTVCVLAVIWFAIWRLSPP